MEHTLIVERRSRRLTRSYIAEMASFGACLQLLCRRTIYANRLVWTVPMSSPSGILHSEPRWRKLYEAAVLELDREVLPRRIDLARKAIRLRVERLLCTGENGETEPLLNALNARRIGKNAGSWSRSAKEKQLNSRPRFTFRQMSDYTACNGPKSAFPQ